jgi:hypothetical protein
VAAVTEVQGPIQSIIDECVELFKVITMVAPVAHTHFNAGVTCEATCLPGVLSLLSGNMLPCSELESFSSSSLHSESFPGKPLGSAPPGWPLSHWAPFQGLWWLFSQLAHQRAEGQ